VLDSLTGNFVSAFLVRTGKGAFRLQTADSLGDWLVMSDNSNRVLLYSISSGELKARFFGSELLSVVSNPGELAIYDLRTLKRRDQFDFPRYLSMDAFSGDGKKLLVLTDDQTAYILDMTKPAASSTATAVAPSLESSAGGFRYQVGQFD
jgi:hypothetical protein